MIHLAKGSRYAELDLSTFEHNLKLPRHRWYAFKEGFSEILVREAISEMSSSKRKPEILDPFAGSGTTMVTAGRLGLKATGIEVNPFLAFASQAKCVADGWQRHAFYRRLDAVLSKSRNEVQSPLEGRSTFTERPGAEKWLFNRSVVRGFTALNRALTSAGRYRKPLLLALIASLMDCCNAKRDGKCLRYVKAWRSAGLTSSDLRIAFRERAEIVFQDIKNDCFDHRGIRVVQGDARRVLRSFRANSFDLIVTSPPYLNSFDYSDVYRPELFAGGFVRDNAELRQIRLSTVRSHLQVNWEPSQIVASPLIPPLVSRMSRKHLWDSRLPAMVQAYFADMADVLRETARIVRPNGRAWIVVSTSAYGGVHIPVDVILADIALRNGWVISGAYFLRPLRAAGQQWACLKGGSNLPLRESLLILERRRTPGVATH